MASTSYVAGLAVRIALVTQNCPRLTLNTFKRGSEYFDLSAACLDAYVFVVINFGSTMQLPPTVMALYFVGTSSTFRMSRHSLHRS